MIRFFLALWLSKLSIIALKITKHNGTYFPGELALKICPDFLEHIGKPEKIIAVTGTNGKTTASNMITDILTDIRGDAPINNNSGSNLNLGIATCLIQNNTLTGKAKKNLGVFEVDEISTRRVFPYIKPDYLLITALFRDSLKRHANVEYIKNIIVNNIPSKTKLILNGDDLISSTINLDNEKVFFGIEKLESDTQECINNVCDVRICPNCHHLLTYDYLRYHHIGRAHCDFCGFSSPDYDYGLKSLDENSGKITVSDKGKDYSYDIINPALHNLYNQLAVISLLREMNFSCEDINKGFKGSGIVSTRLEENTYGNVKVIGIFAKDFNIIGSSRAFDYISKVEGEKELLIMNEVTMDSDTVSNNSSWIYDSDFEYLNDESIKKFVVVGPRRIDIKLRLMLAGIPEDKIVCEEDPLKGPELMNYHKDESLFIVYGSDRIEMPLTGEIIDKTKNLAVERSNPNV